MKINITLLTLCLFLFQSCFTTKYVSDADILRNKYRGSTVDDIEFEFGEPHEVTQTRTGYVYTYYKVGRNYNETFTRFSFDNNDYVRNVQSTNLVPQRVFSGRKTAFAIVFPIVMVYSIITVAYIVAYSE